MRSLVRKLPIGVYITTGAGAILDANPGCLEILGVASLEELRQHRARDLFVDPTERDREMQQLGATGSVIDFELRLRVAGSEHPRTVLDTCYAVEDPATGETLMHGILVDITERKRLEAQLKELTIRDPLTGCFNRRYLYQIEPRLMAQGVIWGAIIIDIDHFKRYNDEHGHQAGDEVLTKMGRYLMRQVRAEDAVIRIGGDEFVVLLIDACSQSTAVVADRMRVEANHGAPAPFSLGWSLRRGDERLEQTIHRADHSLIQIRLAERGERRRSRSSFACLTPKT